MPIGEVVERRSGFRMSEQALRRHDHQRLPVAAVKLTAQGVEQLSRCRQVHHPPVVVSRQLEEALQTSGTVFGSLALVAMGQVHDQA